MESQKGYDNNDLENICKPELEEKKILVIINFD